MSFSPVTSPEPNTVAIESDKNKPTIPHGYGSHDGAQSERFELATQTFDCLGENGCFATGKESVRCEGQSAITSAVRAVFTLYATHEFEYKEKLGDIFRSRDVFFR